MLRRSWLLVRICERYLLHFVSGYLQGAHVPQVEGESKLVPVPGFRLYDVYLDFCVAGDVRLNTITC